MTKFSKSIVLVAVVLSIFGASVASAAVSNVTITSPIAGATVTVNTPVTLTGNSTGGINYAWTASDGTSVPTGANSTVTFTTTGPKTITLTVKDATPAAGVAKTVNVIVVDATTPSGKPVISNIATSGITQTGVTITWTTDIPATSRVIYDTISHPSIVGALPDNFGYAVSSPEITTKTTSHSVTLSGLNPGTKYYFRVISEG